MASRSSVDGVGHNKQPILGSFSLFHCIFGLEILFLMHQKTLGSALAIIHSSPETSEIA